MNCVRGEGEVEGDWFWVTDRLVGNWVCDELGFAVVVRVGETMFVEVGVGAVVGKGKG